MDALATSLRRILREDRDHPVEFVTPVMRAKDETWRRSRQPYLEQGCYLRAQHATDFLSVDVHVRLWQDRAYRREAWHDYLVPATADYTGWTLGYGGQRWRLCTNDDPRYRRHACDACQDASITDADSDHRGHRQRGGRPRLQYRGRAEFRAGAGVRHAGVAREG